MRKLTRRAALLASAKNESNVARSGFVRLMTVLNAIERLADGADKTIMDLASLGSTIAAEFADEARSASEQYALLLDQEARRHG